MTSRYDGPTDDIGPAPLPEHTEQPDCPACKALDNETAANGSEIQELVDVLMDGWDEIFNRVGPKVVENLRAKGKSKIVSFLKRNNIPRGDG